MGGLGSELNAYKISQALSRQFVTHFSNAQLRTLTDVEGSLVRIGLQVVPVMPVVVLQSLVLFMKEGEGNYRLHLIRRRQTHVSLAVQSIKLACVCVCVCVCVYMCVHVCKYRNLPQCNHHH